MIISTFRSSYTREPPRNIIYRNYKNFNVQDFLNDLKTNLRLEEQTSPCVSYDKLTKIFKETTDKHAPQKKRKIRGNQAPFMTKEQVMKRSKSKNFYFKWPSRESFLAYKNEKNKCTNMIKYSKKAYFREITAKKGSKSFWNAIKPFFTNREIITNDSITLEENGVLKNDPKETTEVFNNYYTNIVETTS